MSRFIESIRIEDGKAARLEFHQKRMDEVFAEFGKQNPYKLDKLLKTLHHEDLGLFKWRILYEPTSRFFNSQMIPYAVEIWENFELVDGKEIDYHHKFEDRSALNMLKQKATGEEVIIYQNKHITDSSFSNLIFKKGEQWFTPNTFLLNGIMRQYLIINQLVKEAEITLDNLDQFSHFQLVNAMIPFGTEEYPIEKIINLFTIQSIEI